MYKFSDIEKTQYVKFLLKNGGEAFKAALELYPVDTGRALYLATQFADDPYIKSEIERLKEENYELQFLPTKIDLLKKVWNRLENRMVDADDFCKLARLYSELQGYLVMSKDEGKPKRHLSETEIDTKFTQLINELHAI